ncbi:MAG: hypothetical protein WBL85_01905 [Sedimentisphaerales bacterium]
MKCYSRRSSNQPSLTGPPKGVFVAVTCGIIGRLEAECRKELPEKRLRKT